MSRTIKLILGYDGTDFHGWQVQLHEPTIQGELTNAIERITGVRTHVDSSGRTDRGVHALAQVASFHTDSRIPCENLVKALNSLLPHSIRIYSAEEVEPGFHARFQARAKTYRYQIYRGPVCPPHRWRYVHHFPYPLDIEAMRKAAPQFAGTHDFTSMASSEGRGEAGPEEIPERSKVRTLFVSEVSEEDQSKVQSPRSKVENIRTLDFGFDFGLWTLDLGPGLLVYTARGSGFLHHMVRNIVGTLLEVGKGNLAMEDVARILDARDRTAAGPAAPAKGLWLVGVEY